VLVSLLVVVVVVELGGVDEDETLPLADIEADVEVSLDGVDEVDVSLGGVEELLELLLGEEVSVEAVVVAGVVATVVDVVVELGVALVPELLYADEPGFLLQADSDVAAATAAMQRMRRFMVEAPFNVGSN